MSQTSKNCVYEVNITKKLSKLGTKRLVDAQCQLITIYYDALHAWWLGCALKRAPNSKINVFTCFTSKKRVFSTFREL